MKGLAWAWSKRLQAHHTRPPAPPLSPASVPPAVGNHAPHWRGDKDRTVEGKGGSTI